MRDPFAGTKPMVPLRGIEVACGTPFGLQAGPGLEPTEARSVRAAFEALLRVALATPPCVVSFSGGRDSSALLALAVSVARSAGLPDPVPATLVFPRASETDEESWQRHVLDHLGLTDDWTRIRFEDELDVVGPVAQELLSRHGLFWPFNLHFHLPIVKLARGGAVVTGFGGDELARASASLYAERILAGRGMRRPRDLATVGLRRAPSPIRFGVSLLRDHGEWGVFDWVTRRGRAAAQLLDAAEFARLPEGFGPLVQQWIWRSRYFRICIENFQRMADPFRVRACHPLVEPAVLNALAVASPYAGPRTRSQFVRDLAGDLLPERIVTRPSKATFSSPLWTDTARQFAADWSGDGLDERFVNTARLRSVWLSPLPHVHAATLMQAAWLRTRRR